MSYNLLFLFNVVSQLHFQSIEINLLQYFAWLHHILFRGYLIMYLTPTHMVGYLNFFHYYEQQQNVHPYIHNVRLRDYVIRISP